MAHMIASIATCIFMYVFYGLTFGRSLDKPKFIISSTLSVFIVSIVGLLT